MRRRHYAQQRARGRSQASAQGCALANHRAQLLRTVVRAGCCLRATGCAMGGRAARERRRAWHGQRAAVCRTLSWRRQPPPGDPRGDTTAVLSSRFCFGPVPGSP
ncbi:hypothetical protein F511_45877 [Dorcoceras hygrometricum]|uniref:Uncharacterized protein n=1 Tax=Dorcoceras hygrometricum TaxID=472368 RepID=A0A2Z7A2C1_9LAMI|nr:hypothetical protein F511_45877 [Dorcoceras hygrometricum]